MRTHEPTAPARPVQVLRTEFHQELASMVDELVRLAGRVDLAMTQAGTALLSADLPLAERVIAEDAEIDTVHNVLDERALILLARQQPVATDLRTIIAALRISADLERMGDLARNVAEITRRRHPHQVIPAAVRDVVEEMGRVAADMVAKAAAVVASQDTVLAAELEADDDQMDRLQQRLYGRIADDQESIQDSQAATDVALIGRFYERFADHAAAIAHRIEFLADAYRPVASPGHTS